MLTEVDRESSRLRASTSKQVSALWPPSGMLTARVTTASVTCTCLELLLLSVSLSVIVAQVHAGTFFNMLLISDLVLVKFEAVGKMSRQTLLFDRLLYWPHIVCSGQLRTGNFFCPRTPLIKTVMRLFTAASNYSQLWLCSIDYDSHE